MPIVDERALLVLSCAVHEQLELMEVICDLPEAQYIQKKVNSVHSRLKLVEETLLLMIDFQGVFGELRALANIEEV